jgi:hypothetical protein
MPTSTLTRGSFATKSGLVQSEVLRANKRRGAGLRPPLFGYSVLPLGNHYLLLPVSDSGYELAEVHAIGNPPTVGGAAVPRG